MPLVVYSAVVNVEVESVEELTFSVGFYALVSFHGEW